MSDPKTALGVDIGGTNIRVARVSSAGEILERVTDRVPRGGEAQLRRILELIAQLAAPDVESVGIGVAGRVHLGEQTILSTGYLDLDNVRLGEIVSSTYRLPVTLDNDARVAMVAELHLGAAVGYRDVVMFTIGTGIGGAIARGGALYYGGGMAGQLGHLVVDLHGLPCRCGGRGCVETLSSGTSLRRVVEAAGLPGILSLDDLFARESAGDSLANRVLTEWAYPLRKAIDSAVAAVGPELVLLGGGLGAYALRVIERIPTESPWYQCPVRLALMGDDAGVIGAALQSLERPTEPPG